VFIDFSLNTAFGLIVHTDGCRMARAFVCLFVCLFFARYLENDAAAVTKLDMVMFRCDYQKHLFCGQKVKGHEKHCGVGHCTLVSAGFWFEQIILLPFK